MVLTHQLEAKDYVYLPHMHVFKKVFSESNKKNGIYNNTICVHLKHMDTKMS